MQKVYRTIIIGGGASGLISAVELTRGDNAFHGGDVLILEKNDRVGKKLLATGNGQGNVTNLEIKRENYRGDEAFIESFLALEREIKIKEYLEDLGIFLSGGKEGRMYPVSRQAGAVLDCFREYTAHAGVKEQVLSEVKSVEKKDGIFHIISASGEYLAESVILAAGGKAGEKFGTDGSAYKLAESFSHRITPLYPSLVQLRCKTDPIRGLRGLKEYARVKAFSNGEEIYSATGDVLFTDYGISGSAVFAVSGRLAGKPRPSVIIEFLPDFSEEETLRMVKLRTSKSYLSEPLVGLVAKRVGQAVVRAARSNDAKEITKVLKNFPLEITGDAGFSNAQVTKGGVETQGVNPTTMESKFAENLFITGEMLDVDGDCGGYNLTFAFVTGIAAARALKEKFSKNK